MFRGRPPPRGGYPPPFEGRGPPRPYLGPGYRDDRGRPSYHHDYQDHGHPESFCRSPPRRRYPSPGTGGHRSGEFWSAGPPNERGPPPLDHSLVITVGNELTDPPRPSPSHHHDRDYPRHERGSSRGRSRPRSSSPDQSRAKSRGRSKSRHRGQSRSPDQSRAKSRGRSKSRPRSRSRGRSRGRIRGRSHGRSKSRRRHSSSRSSSSSGYNKDFVELERARRRKELEEMLTQPTKSILKKRNNSDDSPSVRSSLSPQGPDGSNMSRMVEQLLQAVKSTDPCAMASMLAELQSDPHMAQRAGLDKEIREILNLLGGTAPTATSSEKKVEEIDDEEKFLYGDSEDPKTPIAAEAVHNPGLDLFGEVTEDSLYVDPPPHRATGGHTYSSSTTHLQSLPTTNEVKTSYVSRPTIGPDHNITVQVSNPAYPPGTEPLEEDERKALEEYEKIQDLLKTIGLDLGVTEISKMAARTKERLHGNKPPPKTPTRRRHHSSSSSDSSRQGRWRRSRSGSSSSSNESCGRRGEGGRGWSSDEECRRKGGAPPKRSKDREAAETQDEPVKPAELSTPNPPLTGMPIPTYPPPQIHGMMPPNFPPPPFGQFGNYMAYMHQQWPPMYPPPSIPVPPLNRTDAYPPPVSYTAAKGAPTLEQKGSAKVDHTEAERRSSQDSRVSDEMNTESQKQKVLEEREKLKQEREIRMTKKEYLIKELERLRKQQGELLRKKRREKDGHKDPLLQEISRLQEEVMVQISNLRKEHEAAEKKRNEIEKVALILGLNPSDRPRRSSKPTEVQLQEPPQKKQNSPESHDAPSSSAVKAKETLSPKRTSHGTLPATTGAPAPAPDPFEYYDAGNHWCQNCNVTSGSMFDFFTHLHSKVHRKTLDPYHRPWALTSVKISKSIPTEEKQTKPAKGSEFMVPVRGFFCLLCKEFYGDAICAEEHVVTHAHNEKYKKQMYENPLYEQRRNLDRQAGLAMEMSGKKRKHDEDDKGSREKEEKIKHKKEKKDKEKKRDEEEEEESLQKEEKPKVKQEEAEEKWKQMKREEDLKKSMEEEKPSYTRKEDKSRYSKEDDDRASRYRNSRDDEYRYRRDKCDRYTDRPKYGPSENQDRYKHKYSDVKSRERDEGKPKPEWDTPKKPEADRPETTSGPPKPYELPKIFCGPSPAMRAKLRKQSLEAAKPPPGTTGTSFGKFTWKKKENQLAKEAQRAAAEFLKDDEMASRQDQVSSEDSFANSMSIAKDLASKFGGEQGPASWSANRGRIRPNLPAPAAQQRRPAMTGKPAHLNTFLNIRPQGGSVSVPGPTPMTNSPLCAAQPAPQFIKPGPFEPMVSITVTKAEPFGPKLPPSMLSPTPGGGSSLPPVSVPCPVVSKPQLTEAKLTPPVQSKPAPVQSMPPPVWSRSQPVQSIPAPVPSKPAPVPSKPAPVPSKPSTPDPKSTLQESKPALFQSKPTQIVVNPAPEVVNPSPSQLGTFESKGAKKEVKPSSSQANNKPAAAPKASAVPPTMIKIVSDVPAPGVPESEQTRTVFVKPPPFMLKADGAPKSEKLKSNLAAAEAQQLFGIFYNSGGQSGPSSFSRQESNTRAEKFSNGKPPLKAPEAALKVQPQAQPEVKPQSQPDSPAPCQQKPQLQHRDKPQVQMESSSVSPPTTKELVVSGTSSRDALPNPQKQSDTNLQITSVWSLQSTTGSTFEFGSPQPVQPESAAPCEKQNSSQIQPPSPKPQSHTVPNKFSGLEPTSDPLQFQTEPQSEAQPDHDALPLSEATPEPKSKPGPKTRGKGASTKKTTPPSGPTRQTRSQTRYQTRHQQQQQNPSEPEPKQAPGDPDSTDSESKGVETSNPGSGTQLAEGQPLIEVTPETLGLPADMASLDFEFDFNFE